MQPFTLLTALSISILFQGCVAFDDYPVGDLCEHAERDEEGRAVRYPEWRICEPIDPTAGGAGGQSDHDKKNSKGRSDEEAPND